MEISPYVMANKQYLNKCEIKQRISDSTSSAHMPCLYHTSLCISCSIKVDLSTKGGEWTRMLSVWAAWGEMLSVIERFLYYSITFHYFSVGMNCICVVHAAKCSWQIVCLLPFLAVKTQVGETIQ